MRLIKQILIVGAILFLFAGTFGITQTGMAANDSKQMSGCPFAGVSALCHMSPLEHAFMLQNTLTAVPFSVLLAFFTSLLVAISIIFLAPIIWNSTCFLFEPILRPPARTYRTIPRYTLQEAFASGILNSKAF